jgi:hypothetical protein
VVVALQTSKDLLEQLQVYVSTIAPRSCLLFTMSSHGYSTVVPARSGVELNGRSEYVTVGHDRVFDTQLFQALYGTMRQDTISLCLVDTCHSGTMLDLEYISTDGTRFVRSGTPLTSRPLSVCISACNDDEQAGEDVSDFGGWGGKLTCAFLDQMKTSTFSIAVFYRKILVDFTTQRYQASHPILSINVP